MFGGSDDCDRFRKKLTIGRCAQDANVQDETGRASQESLPDMVGARRSWNAANEPGALFIQCPFFVNFSRQIFIIEVLT
ncbi:hypothetical protein KCP69_07890 [Salmonella enterica subsp. enterica]|nr:hypothetical protein KCP69_07890 [Salmonella enterica subsp. enterica]